MNEFIEAGEGLGRTVGRERMVRPMAGSLALHAGLAGTVVFWAVFNGLFHHNTWGGTPGGGTIQVTITSALPLPAQKVNDNVLTTETPSPAPATPSPKEQRAIDTTAIPIQGKQAKQKVAQNIPKTQPHQQPPKDDYRAHYGEQSGSAMPRSMAQGASGPTQVSDTAFGTLYQWYVDGISRKLQANQDLREVDGRTPAGSHTFLSFTVRRDGMPSDVQVLQSSGSSTLDRSCVRAVERVDTFGPLPSNYNHSTVLVSYDCQYQGGH